MKQEKVYVYGFTFSGHFCNRGRAVVLERDSRDTAYIARIRIEGFEESDLVHVKQLRKRIKAKK